MTHTVHMAIYLALYVGGGRSGLRSEMPVDKSNLSGGPQNQYHANFEADQGAVGAFQSELATGHWLVGQVGQQF